MFLSLLLDVETGEAHEGHCHQSHGDEGDTKALQGFGHIGVGHLFTDGSQAYDGQQPRRG